MSPSLVTLIAQDPAPASPTLFSPMLLFVGATFFLFYFLVIAPEKRRKADEEKARGSLKKNDRVVTVGGIHGTVADIGDDDVVTIRVDNTTRLKINRSAIGHVVEAKTAEKPTKDSGADVTTTPESGR